MSINLNDNRQHINIVIVGHVDHGKSTIIGRLLADTNSLPEGKLEQVKEKCKRTSKPFEYAFLLDALKDEQEQGITIDAARCFFKTKKRDYIIIDAPGHIEFLKNMVTGAARAEVALLVIDAKEGIKENSKRHGYLLSMLGIKNVAVLINKMDLVDYDEEVYNNISKEYTAFLNEIDIHPTCFIPASGFYGDNIIGVSEETPWYKGDSVLEVLDGFEAEKDEDHKPFRMPVQDVYKFTKDGDDRRIVAGTIETGKVKVGDEITFYPSAKKSTIRTIEQFNGERVTSIGAGFSTGFTLEEQIYIKRGEIATLSSEAPIKTASRFRTNLFWLGKKPLTVDKEYILKVGTAKVRVRIEDVLRVIDASNLNNELKDRVDRHEVAECVLKTVKPIAFDLSNEIAKTSRFVIIDEYEIAGGGIIQEAFSSVADTTNNISLLKDVIHDRGLVSQEARAEKYGQKPSLVLITGKEDIGKRQIAKTLEKSLFDSGRFAYFFGNSEPAYGIGTVSSIERRDYRNKDLERLADIASILLDAGKIVIATSDEISREEIDLLSTSIDPEKIIKVWVGKEVTTDITSDVVVEDFDKSDIAAGHIQGELQELGILTGS